jgi:hypothetical protein
MDELRNQPPEKNLIKNRRLVLDDTDRGCLGKVCSAQKRRRLYATSTSRRSMTFVSVGPITNKSPTVFSKG